MQDILHISSEIVEAWSESNKVCHHEQDSIQTPKPLHQETLIEGTAVIQIGSNREWVSICIHAALYIHIYVYYRLQGFPNLGESTHYGVWYVFSGGQQSLVSTSFSSRACGTSVIDDNCRSTPVK